MKQEDIIRMAREAGIATKSNWAEQELERFAQLVRNDYSNKHAQLWLKRIDEAVKAEREACAKVCDEISDVAHFDWKATYKLIHQGEETGASDCADAIRARKQQ